MRSPDRVRGRLKDTWSSSGSHVVIITVGVLGKGITVSVVIKTCTWLGAFTYDRVTVTGEVSMGLMRSTAKGLDVLSRER